MTGTDEFIVLCAKWRNPNPEREAKFTAEHVNVFASMIERHLHIPHRTVCMTDDPTGVQCQVMPIWKDHIETPHHPLVSTQVNCYSKMRVFDPIVAHFFGKRMLWMDLDCVITDDITELVTRYDDPFVGWQPELPRWAWKRPQYSGAMFLITPGDPTITDVWTSFDIDTSPKIAMDEGYCGSDQAWMSLVLGEDRPVWTQEDGIRWEPVEKGLPEGTRIMFFTGINPPWSESNQQIDWIKEHWK